MLNRLGLVLHWIGFLFQFGFLFGYLPGLFFFQADRDFEQFLYEVEDIVEIIFFDWGYYDIKEIILVWGAVASWPITFILTGNKSFLPWRRDQ